MKRSYRLAGAKGGLNAVEIAPLVALAAAAVPALRTTRVDPVVALTSG